jgi:alpha 1,6-mannosyltransferase
MSRRVLRADFLRYLLLAIEGGVYSDIDTELLKPIHEWEPDEFKSRTKLIVRLEADQSPPVAGDDI